MDLSIFYVWKCAWCGNAENGVGGKEMDFFSFWKAINWSKCILMVSVYIWLSIYTNNAILCIIWKFDLSSRGVLGRIYALSIEVLQRQSVIKYFAILRRGLRIHGKRVLGATSAYLSANYDSHSGQLSRRPTIWRQRLDWNTVLNLRSLKLSVIRQNWVFIHCNSYSRRIFWSGLNIK